jgi:hypothetical protein
MFAMTLWVYSLHESLVPVMHANSPKKSVGSFLRQQRRDACPVNDIWCCLPTWSFDNKGVFSILWLHGSKTRIDMVSRPEVLVSGGIRVFVEHDECASITCITKSGGVML